MVLEKPLEEPVSSGCLNCGSRPIEGRLDMVLAVGFGDVNVTKDGKIIWSCDDASKRLSDFEAMAILEPGDWRVSFNAPLWSATWQRHAPGKWLLIAKGEGFA